MDPLRDLGPDPRLPEVRARLEEMQRAVLADFLIVRRPSHHRVRRFVVPAASLQVADDGRVRRVGKRLGDHRR
ncbi:hypothetical protein [Aureimonas sp. Leaf324]|uniref:hypothetical protein n=1 Tax=Aureimonas sp. Leaf324 TaxID=1736336 RepID=UPI00138F747F|nr:hypothetical protein [Aureimonas sp. Leaf324]